MSPYRSAAPDTQLRNARRTWVRACALAQRLLKVRRLTEMWALSACTALLAVCALAFWLDAQRYDVLSIQAGRAAAIIVTAACVACLMWALLRPVRAGWLLTRIESEDASFDGLLVSAMELQDLPSEGAHQSEALTARLFEQAAVRIASDHPWQTRERRRCKQAGVVAVAPLLVAATLGVVGPDWLVMGVSLLINQTSATQAINPYSVTVEPGDVKLLEGDDLVIRAHSIGFSPDITEPGAVSLFVREHAQAPWQVREMNPDASGSGEGSDTGHTFHAILLSLSTGFQYRAEVEGLESPIHRVTVIPRPKLQKIGLDYRYPIHTGAAPKTVEDGGDIAAVKGTMVRVRVTADSPARAASLQFASAATVPLRLQDGEWVGTVQLSQNDSYRVELASALGGDLRAASREFSVQALVDTLPKVAIARPGKDAKVSSIEEVSIEVHASDDVAVRDLHLLMSVNGAPEQEVLIGGEASQIRNGIHTVYLEEMALNAGDLIAFHARARDSSVTARTVESDIFFLEVRPYERSYRRGGGGGGGGRGGANRSMLAAQQRTLVIALFKMVRDEPKLSEHQKVSQVETLTAAQLRIRERVEAITRRLGQRRVFDGEPGYQQMAKELPKASVAMAMVEASLATSTVREALPSARQALLHLQRADAAFREVRISQSRRGGGGSQANDLANLFKLEMDSFKSQYAHVQRAQRETAKRDLDETMRKLEELARRQEQELANRDPASVSGIGDASAQAAIARQVEALLRRLERLTRERPDPQLESARKQLSEAASAMREGSAGGNQKGGAASESAEQGQSGARQGAEGAGEAGQRGDDSKQALSSAERALQGLREARRALRNVGRQALANQVEAARGQAQTMVEQQQAIEQVVQTLKERTGEDAQAQRRKVTGEKQQLAAGENSLDGLIAKALAIALKGGNEARASAATALRSAAQALRAAELTSALEETAARLMEGQASVVAEREISRKLRTIVGHLDEASQAAAAGSRRDEKNVRERLAQSTRQLAQLAQALSEQSTGGRDPAGRQSGTGRQGQDGRRGLGARQGGAGQREGTQSGDAAGARRGGVAAENTGQAGGIWGRRINGNFDRIRGHLRASARALGDSVGIRPTTQGARNIDALVAKMEAGANAPTQALANDLDALVRELQGVERQLRQGEDGLPVKLSALRQNAVQTKYRRLVEGYYRQLSDDR